MTQFHSTSFSGNFTLQKKINHIPNSLLPLLSIPMEAYSFYTSRPESRISSILFFIANYISVPLIIIPPPLRNYLVLLLFPPLSLLMCTIHWNLELLAHSTSSQPNSSYNMWQFQSVIHVSSSGLSKPSPFRSLSFSSRKTISSILHHHSICISQFLLKCQ